MKIWKLIRYVMKDAYEYWKSGGYKRLFGVFMFVGEVGQGKTMSMINHIKNLQASDERIKVYTNFHYKGQDGQINHWSDMLNVPSYSIIALDEIQNTFDQRSWNSFPPQMVQLLTQNRKWGNTDGESRPPGILLLMTTQDYENTDVVIRRLTNRVIQCSAYFKGRAIFNRWYSRKEYEKTDSKRNNAGLKWFVAEDEKRDAYDTYKILKSMKEEAPLVK